MSRCLCDCGNETVTYNEFLLNGRTRSCGCYRKELMSTRQTTHGQSKSHLYGVWLSMKRRCDYANGKYYMDYGGRGITVCREWADSYEAFAQWAKESGYKQGLSIDRIDVNDGYYPQNCRWATAQIQANNRRSNHMVTYDGETHTVKEWSDRIGIPYKTLHNRLRSGWDISRALTP